MKISNGLLLAAGLGALIGIRASLRRKRKMDLTGKTVLLTGGSRGLGLVLARQLVEQGVKLAICARNADELEQARAELAGLGGDVLAVPCDVTNEQEVMALAATVRAHFGPVDILINNAGVIQVGPMESMTLFEYEEAMKTHFYAPLYTTLALAPEMQQRRQGRIVNISSIGGKISLPHQIPYSASKYALVGLSEGLRAELKKDNVFVTTVCPWLTRTGSPRNVIVKGQNKKEYAWFSIVDSLPLFTMSAESAAAKIIEAIIYGDAELVLSIAGKVFVGFHGLFPNLASDVMAQINEFLPAPGGIGTERTRGYASESSLSPSLLTALTEKAAWKNNEISYGGEYREDSK